MRRKTVLVTGGAGFIGSHLVEKLLGRGDVVVVVDNFNRYYSPKRKQENLRKVKNNPNFFMHRVDVRNKKELRQVFLKNRFDCVVHLAAMAGVRVSIEKPKLYAQVNVLGTANLLEQMKDFGVAQLVLASSSSVYGNRTTGPFREDDRTDKQISPYGATKKAAEMLCHVYGHLYGIKTMVLRFFTVYGPRNRPDMACFKFVDAVMRGKPIMRFGKGDSGRDYTYIDDTVAGVIGAIDNPVDFEVVNLGNSEPIKLNQLIKVIEQVTKKKAKVNELPTQPGDVELTWADISKAKKLLGYSPKVRLREGIERLYRWYREQNIGGNL